MASTMFSRPVTLDPSTLRTMSPFFRPALAAGLSELISAILAAPSASSSCTPRNPALRMRAGMDSRECGLRVATLTTPIDTGSAPVPGEASQLPTSALLLSRHSIARSPFVSILSIARSCFSSAPTSRAGNDRPSLSLQLRTPSSFSSLALVMIQPSSLRMVPSTASLPSQSTRTVLWLARATTSRNAETTDGLLLRISWAQTGAAMPSDRIPASSKPSRRCEEGVRMFVMDGRSG